VPRLRELVAGKLGDDWSPEQISGWLARTYPGEQDLQVSTETIYRSLFVQARGVLRKELTAHLRTRRTMRRSRQATRSGQGRGGIVDAVSIRERPAEASDRAVPGHWEGDLLAGSANTHIVTLVERQSRYVLLVKVAGKDTTTVVDALASHIQTPPVQLRATITWDRGMELADHRRFTVATDVAVYFCDPRSPWQRGTNENTNGLLRQYFPRHTDLSVHSQADLDAVAARLNTSRARPSSTRRLLLGSPRLLHRPPECAVARLRISTSSRSRRFSRRNTASSWRSWLVSPPSPRVSASRSAWRTHSRTAVSVRSKSRATCPIERSPRWHSSTNSALNSAVKDRRARGCLRSMVSMMDILPGATPLIVDVRQSGSGPGQADAGTTADSSDLKATQRVPVAQRVMPWCQRQSLPAILPDRLDHTHSCINACGCWRLEHDPYRMRWR
jgi:IS30 family transposase